MDILHQNFTSSPQITNYPPPLEYAYDFETGLLSEHGEVARDGKDLCARVLALSH